MSAERLTGRLVARAAGLCLVAGYVDALGYTELGGVFAANMTGNSVLMAIAAARGLWPRTESYAATLAAFLAGAIVACVLRRWTGRPAVVLLAASALLMAAAMAPLPPGLSLPLLAATMGMQGAAISRFGPAALQTVVVTGTMVRLADELVEPWWPSAVQPIAGAAWLDGAAWLAYVAAAAAAVAMRRVMDRPLLLAALMLLLIAAEVAADEHAQRRNSAR